MEGIIMIKLTELVKENKRKDLLKVATTLGKSPSDINKFLKKHKLDADDLLDMEGFQDRSAKKLVSNIKNAVNSVNLIELMNELGTTIFLEASVQTLSSRLISASENRPLLPKNKSLAELNYQIKAHLQSRSFLYSKSKNKVVVDLKSTIQIQAEILEVLKIK